MVPTGQCVECLVFIQRIDRGYRGGSPTAVQAWRPALCGSHPLVTPYYCRLGDLLCFLLYVCDYCVFLLSVYYMFLQYFDTVGWVF